MRIQIPERYRKLRKALDFDEVPLGYRAVILATSDQLDEAQTGYGVVEGESSWESEWVVIGHEDQAGDPVFIDTSDEDYPVYTAEHGQGEWNAQLIAFSFRNFVEILRRIKTLARGRSNPVELERNPIREEERESVLDFIRQNNPDVNMSFWETWFE